MGNGLQLFFSALYAFAAFILAIIACAGSTANYNPINKIFVAQLDIQNISISEVFPSVSSSSSTSELGLPDYFNIGLWSYCLQYSNGTVTSCTKPKGIQNFNLKTILYDNIEDNEVSKLIDEISDVVLPSSLQDKMTLYNNVVKAMFITLLIGICIMFLAFVVNAIRWVIHARFITWIGRFLALVGFLSLLVSGATSLGCYLYVKHLLKENYDSTGVLLTVGTTFEGILWGSIFAALLTFVLWCLVRPREVAYISRVPMEEKPLIV